MKPARSIVIAFIVIAVGLIAQPLHAQWSSNGTKIFYNTNNVGIGTSSPAYKFDVRSSGSRVIYALASATSGTTYGVYAQNKSTSGRAIFGHANAASGTNYAVYGKTDSASGFAGYFTGGRSYFQGDVGIGTTTPASKLTVVANSNIALNCQTPSTGFLAMSLLTSATASSGLNYALVAQTSSPSGYAGYFLGGMNYFEGNVGIGLDPPIYRLDLPNIPSSAGQGRANAWTTYSSIRWKQNVQPIENALEKVMRLQGVMFDWKPEQGGTHDIGFIAEDVGAVVPELVSWEADGQFAQSLKYDRITALTVEAIKQQQGQMRRVRAELDRQINVLRGEHESELASLRQENAVQRDQITDLTARLQTLERQMSAIKD